MEDKTYAILGCGSMGTAILAGMIKAHVKPEKVKVTAKRTESAEALSKKFHVTGYSTDYQPNANSLAVEGAQIVLLAVKPAYITQVLDEIKHVLREDALVISVAAGITTATMEEHVSSNVAVIRAMPNTPALIKKGLTGISAGSRVTPEQLKIATDLFDGVGKTLVIPEEKIDALSTISGSGPAYVFYFIEEFIKTSIAMGFSQDEAYLLVSETFLGASELLVDSQKDPADLRRQVTSPNGTTMRAVAVLEEGNLHGLFLNATNSALARAKEIAQEMK